MDLTAIKTSIWLFSIVLWITPICIICFIFLGSIFLSHFNLWLVFLSTVMTCALEDFKITLRIVWKNWVSLGQERESQWNFRAKHKRFTDLLFEVLVWGVSFSCQKMENSLQGSYQSFLFSASWEMTKQMVIVWHRIFLISNLCKFSLTKPISLTFPPDSLKIVLHTLLKLGTLSQTSVLQAMFKFCQIGE